MEQRPHFPDVLQYLGQQICAVKAEIKEQVWVDKGCWSTARLVLESIKRLNCSCAAHLGQPGAMHPIPNTCTNLCSSFLHKSGTNAQIIPVSYRSLQWPNLHVQLQHQHENYMQLLQAKVHAPIILKGGCFIIAALLYHPFNWYVPSL